jgi:hypothetical protein
MERKFKKEEYNKLCAEFLGYVNTTPTDKDFNIHEHPITKKMIETNFDKRFLQDWNWIMEVVEYIPQKVQGINISIHPNSCLITDTGVRGQYSLNASKNIVKFLDAPTRKEAVVQALWEFLNWYNEQKQ